MGTGSQLKYLKRIAKKNIEFLGWQSDKAVYEYMRTAKALIFPGEEDAGITPIESMATGRPVIAYKKGGVLESVIENKTGIFFEELSTQSRVKAVLSFEDNILNFSPKTCRENALKFSEVNFEDKLKKTIETSYKEYQSGFLNAKN